MKRNPVVPYAIIAVIGILVVIVISYVGANERNLANNPDEGDVVVRDAEEIFDASCLTCHATGGMGPALDTVGASLSLDEIKDIITNGKGSMPPMTSQLSAEEIAVISEWLSEKK